MKSECKEWRIKLQAYSINMWQPYGNIGNVRAKVFKEQNMFLYICDTRIGKNMEQ